jgi:MFS family permease
MNGLALTLALQYVTGRYDAAGVVTACFLIAAACSAPFVGRWIDQRGPHGVVPILCALYVASMLALFSIPAGSPLIDFAALGGLGGATLPPISTLCRAMWAKSDLTDTEKRAGFSLEGVITEMAFMLGPVLVSASIAVANPRAGLLTAALFCAVGTMGFILSGGTRQWGRVETDVTRDWLGPLRSPKFALVMAISFVQCVGFGFNEMVFIAYSKATDQQALVGGLYFAACLSSAVGTLWFGGYRSARPLRHWVCMFAVYTAAMFSAMALAFTYSAMLALSFFSGAFVGALIAATFTLSAQVVPTRYATEAGTWIASMLLAGIASGFAAAGVFLQHIGSWSGLAVVSGVPLSLVALLSLRLP